MVDPKTQLSPHDFALLHATFSFNEGGVYTVLLLCGLKTINRQKIWTFIQWGVYNRSKYLSLDQPIKGIVLFTLMAEYADAYQP